MNPELCSYVVFIGNKSEIERHWPHILHRVGRESGQVMKTNGLYVLSRNWCGCRSRNRVSSDGLLLHSHAACSTQELARMMMFASTAKVGYGNNYGGSCTWPVHCSANSWELFQPTDFMNGWCWCSEVGIHTLDLSSYIAGEVILGPWGIMLF